jgi:hypothetical protein
MQARSMRHPRQVWRVRLEILVQLAAIEIRQPRVERLIETCSMTIPRTAIASKLAIRETALLTPEAVPTRSCAMEFITVVVSGATLTAIPIPSTTTAGKKVFQ